MLVVANISRVSVSRNGTYCNESYWWFKTELALTARFDHPEYERWNVRDPHR